MCTAAQAGAVTTAELCDALGLQELKNRKWHVQGSIAIKGEGLYEVMTYDVAVGRWCCTCGCFATCFGLPQSSHGRS